MEKNSWISYQQYISFPKNDFLKMEDEVNLKLFWRGFSFDFNVSIEILVLQLKEIINLKFKNLNINNIVLIYNGEIMNNDKKIDYYYQNNKNKIEMFIN